MHATDITSLSQITDSDGTYVITQDITGGTAGVTTFNGTLEAAINSTTHMPYKISGLTAPLFTTLTGTVKNLVLDNVTITSGDASGNTGAIACTANSAARIYNVGILSGSVGGSNYVGGLVGLLDGTARVINCYSYANITAGTEKAGIVGHNNYASKSSDIKTMVMNCMFYGNIVTGNSVYPIYGGSEISNEDDKKLNNYNYFRYESDFSKNNLITAYNRALAAEERYLVRFEFYRYILNSTRELASWYVYGSVQSDAHSKMLKWVLDKSLKPYPILKEQAYYPSVVNYDPYNTFDSESGVNVARTTVSERNKGKNLGTLTVNISIGSGYPSGAAIKNGKSQITLQRTDKDYDNFNFNYDKVQLPYYNDIGTGNYTKSKVVTGWKITSMTGGTQGTFTAADQWGGYDFANRSTYAKDLYSQSGQVFSQGAYFDVPDNVTAINIEPYWGNAAYLADKYYDCYGYGLSNGVTDFGTHFNNGSNYSINGDEQPVYTSMSQNGNNNDARDRLAALGMDNSSSVYDYAIVLVGNFHFQQTGHDQSDVPFTIMSADLDFDNEPDYSLFYNSGKGLQMHPIRFDFVNVPGTAMAHKKSGTYMGILGNHKWRGWLEVTNTTFIRFSQLEYDNEYKTGNKAPLILLGGVVEQVVSTNGTNDANTANHTKYIHIGSNVWFKLFNNGCHADKTKVQTAHVPISVTGGDYLNFYLSGYFKPESPARTDDAECYISGGRFGEVAGAGQEEIKGDVTWYINRADIDAFYGGGINDKKPITGDINTTIINSNVGKYCGGPKFGNMQPGKKVSTTATRCSFGTYYGAGYGGTSLYRYLWTNGNGNNGHSWYNQVNYSWDSWLTDANNGYIRGKYDKDKGILIQFEYEHFEGSNDKTVARLYTLYASMSVAQTNDVSSTLSHCSVTHNFYGGGNLGKANGDITSILDSDTIQGHVFGGGFSATPPEAEVYDTPASTIKIPNYNENTGVFESGEYPSSVVYIWSNNKGGNTNATTLVDDNGHWIHTDVPLSGLGVVDGKVDLTLKGTTLVSGSVYGGGDASGISGSNHNVTVTLKDDTKVMGNVFGGGNEGEVEGSTEVNVE